jgi:hypothetical protein
MIRKTNIERVANEVALKVRTGQLVKLGEIMRSVGYSENFSKQPIRITRTKTYMDKAKTVLEAIDEEIKRLQYAIAQKDLSKEDYKVQIASLDILIKNKQLLSGGATERKVFVLPSEVLGINDIQTAEFKEIDHVQPLQDGSIKP